MERFAQAYVLPKDADYVGTRACVSCHAQEHETWSEHPHARALVTSDDPAGLAKMLIDYSFEEIIKGHKGVNGNGESAGKPSLSRPSQ